MKDIKTKIKNAIIALGMEIAHITLRYYVESRLEKGFDDDIEKIEESINDFMQQIKDGLKIQPIIRDKY